MATSSDVKNQEQQAPRAGAGGMLSLATAQRVLPGVVAGLLAASLLLPGLVLAAGKKADKPQQPAAAAATTSPGTGHKVSPYVRASRERALASKPGHRPRLHLSARGAQRQGR